MTGRQRQASSDCRLVSFNTQDKALQFADLAGSDALKPGIELFSGASAEQVGELLAAAGYAPPLALLQATTAQEATGPVLSVSMAEADSATRLAKQLYLLAQEVPAALQAPFSEEMLHLLGYGRYKYILSGG